MGLQYFASKLAFPQVAEDAKTRSLKIQTFEELRKRLKGRVGSEGVALIEEWVSDSIFAVLIFNLHLVIRKLGFCVDQLFSRNFARNLLRL